MQRRHLHLRFSSRSLRTCVTIALLEEHFLTRISMARYGKSANHSDLSVLDFYRFVAALGVFIFHLKNIDKRHLACLERLFRPFRRHVLHPVGLRHLLFLSRRLRWTRSYFRFLVRRIARIYPLHFLTLLCSQPLLFLWDQPAPTPQSSLPDFIHNLFLVQAWGVTDHLSFNSPAWSISAELFCYLLFPLFMLLAGRVVPRSYSQSLSGSATESLLTPTCRSGRIARRCMGPI